MNTLTRRLYAARAQGAAPATALAHPVEAPAAPAAARVAARPLADVRPAATVDSHGPDPLAAYRIAREPYWRAVGDEVALYEAAYAVRMPMMLKGPTGCGKTRFVEYMAWKLGKPLITVACHEDMTASDLVGRFLLDAQGTRWQDGPLALAARYGAICYLDEVVEARQDTTVVIHPLTDKRRMLPLEKKGEVIEAHPDFQLVISFNPGYQSLMKDLKQSTKQRFGALDFDYPEHEVEVEIVAHESGVDAATAAKLVHIAERARNLKGHGLDEGISTRMLIHAGSLIAQGVPPLSACRMALVRPITDDADMRDALDAAVTTYF
ncbi:CbbQ/NirQ/NorQ/GpvN family protein [Tepidimonas sp.]|uniref:CbbQ/NirQ/NorQ/GpvN family protein n=1 Tax=Tepidimonas sp. TaxID=2002775 RepID=UPI002FE098D8